MLLDFSLTLKILLEDKATIDLRSLVLAVRVVVQVLQINFFAYQDFKAQ